MSTSAPCPCEGTQDPQVVTNPPGLPTIAYRVDDFAGFRRALLRSLPDETALAGWRPVAGDLGLQVLEWWAYLADILTFYNERIANEDYLGTAQLPGSVTGLVALLGYQPRPGIAATGQLAALRSPRNQQEPLMIAQGTQFANQATPGVPVQTYEALSAQTFTSPVSNTTVLPQADSSLPHIDPGTGAASVLLAGKVSGLAPGEQLLLLHQGWQGADQNWAQATVNMVAPEVDPYGATNTRVTFSSVVWGLQEPTPRPTVIVEAARFEEQGDLHGYDPVSMVWAVDPLRSAPAPDPPESDPKAQNYQLFRSLQSAALWSAGDPTTTGSYQDGTFGVRLSAVVRSFAPGDPVLFTDASTGGGAVMAIVAGTSEEFLTVPYPGPKPPTPATIPVSHTVLALTLQGEADADSVVDLSSTATVVRHAFRQVGTIIPSPATALPPLQATFTAVTALPPLDSALAFLEDSTGAGIPVLATTDSDGMSVTLKATTGTPSSPSLELPVQLLIDLVTISQGTTVPSELLGTGNASLANQTFTLSKSPLTYLPQGAGYASALEVAVDGTYWTEVSSFYGQATTAQVFVVTQQSDGKSVVRFGDGSAGARLPTGSQVVAAYRYGSGAATPPAGRLTTILKPQTNLASVHSPVVLGGGADPEPPSSMRTAAPASVLTFGRAISADDYVTIAQQTSGVDRARAYWTWDATSQRAMIKIYVGDQPTAVGLATNSLAGSDDPNRPVAVIAATPIELDISCGLVIAPDAVGANVLAAAQAAVAEMFAPANMAIGQQLYSSQLEAALMVPGATAVQGLQVVVPGRIRFQRATTFDVPGVGRRGPVVGPLENDLFSGPIAVADPGEGSYYTLSGTPSITQVTSGG